MPIVPLVVVWENMLVFMFGPFLHTIRTTSELTLNPKPYAYLYPKPQKKLSPML